MDLTEIRQKKKKLEATILQEISAFERETTLVLDQIQLHHALPTQASVQQQTIDVEASVIVF